MLKDSVINAGWMRYNRAWRSIQRSAGRWARHSGACLLHSQPPGGRAARLTTRGFTFHYHSTLDAPWQAAATRALNAGATMDKVIALLKEARARAAARRLPGLKPAGEARAFGCVARL